MELPDMDSNYISHFVYCAFTKDSNEIVFTGANEFYKPIFGYIDSKTGILNEVYYVTMSDNDSFLDGYLLRGIA